MQRREFLMGLVASGVVAASATAASGASAAWAVSGPVAVLKCGSGKDDAFLQGVAAACDRAPEVVPFDTSALYRAGAAPAFKRLRGRPVVGVMGDSDFVLFRELARDLGGRFLITGQHVWGDRGSRHLVSTTPQSRGVGGVAEDAIGAPVGEESSGSAGSHAGGGSGLTVVSDDWAAFIGEALGRVATARWRTGPVREANLSLGAGRASGGGSLSTFVLTL